MLVHSLAKQNLPQKPAAPRDLTVSVGGLAVSLRTADPEFASMLEDRYSGFISETANPQFCFEVILCDPRRTSADDDVRVSRETGSWHIVRGDFSASWQISTGQGWVRQSPNPYSTDTLLRILHSIAVTESGGFLLHAASAVRNGRAFLFAGVSGAGKTTLAHLAPPDVRVLTDEISYVVKQAQGYRACGTPFAGELARLGENISAPLAGLFFLKKSSRNCLEPIEPSVALRALMRNILFLASESERVRRVFNTAAEFISAVPVWQMEFTADARAWDIVA